MKENALIYRTKQSLTLRGVGTFGVVDFLHSVIGEATDNLTQSEVEQMDTALGNASVQSKTEGTGTSRGGPDASSGSGGSALSSMTSLLSQVPGAGGLVQQAQNLQQQSDEQERKNAGGTAPPAPPSFAAPPGSTGGPPGSNIPGTNIDPKKTVAQIYPILEFRDKVARAISATIEKIPGLQKLVEKITETLTLFILGLLAPFIRPIINAVADQLKTGSSGVIGASGRHQYEPWTDPQCTDPTHSLLSKDHFSNILNEPAGKVASAILQYVAPRVIYAWENPSIPVDQVLNDVVRVFHHPAIRDPHCELHRNMFSTVETWARSRPDGGRGLDILLSAQSVKDGKNHTKTSEEGNQFGSLPGMENIMSHGHGHGAPGGQGAHGTSNYVPHMPQGMPHIPHMPNVPHLPHIPGASHLPGPFGGVFREGPGEDYPGAHPGSEPTYPAQPSPQPSPYQFEQPPSQGGQSDSYYGGAPQYGQQEQQQFAPQQPQYGYNPSQQYGYGGPSQYYGSGQY